MRQRTLYEMGYFIINDYMNHVIIRDSFNNREPAAGSSGWNQCSASESDDLFSEEEDLDYLFNDNIETVAEDPVP